MYSPTAMQHFLKPRHAGALQGPDVATGHAENADCGDTATFFLRIVADRVAAVGFVSLGCAGAIAACSAAASCLADQDLATAQALNVAQIEALLAPWPAAKRGCTAMAVAAVHRALGGAG